MDLSGTSAVVTGGAGLLGRETARMLTEAGARVVAVDVAQEALDALEAYVPGVTVARGDVADEDDMATAMREAAALAPLRVVVCCAGTGFVKRLVAADGALHDLTSLREMVDQHVIGTFNTMVQAAAVMRENAPDAGGERGVIVTTASVAGLEGSAGQCAYGMVKAAVAGLTLPAARDLGVLGIRVLSIAPNGMAPDGYEAGHPSELRILEQTSFPRRFGRPSEYADLVAMLVEHRYLNAQVVRLDGGCRLPMK